MAGVRLTSGVTLDIVMNLLVQTVAEASILPADAVYSVIDDEVLPLKQPPHKRFITIRQPPFNWEHGEVFRGTATGGVQNISRFMLRGQTRVTLWLKDQTDIWGRFDSGMKAATAPQGSSLLGRLALLLWEKELTDVNGDYVLDECLGFEEYESPGPGMDDWRPFRLTYTVAFTWDLSVA